MNRCVTHSKPWIVAADEEAIRGALQGGQLARGALVHRFEQAVATRTSTGRAFAVASGTAAMWLALRAIDVAEREVVLPSYVCKQVLQAVEEAGATPVLCDIGTQWRMTPDNVAPCISSSTACIVLVHTFGFMCDVRAFEQFGVPILEDCCQAFGARFGGDEAGSLGTASVFSFHATKCLTTAQGGMAVFRDPYLSERAASIGTELFPMSDTQAALGLSQLSRYDQFLEKRQFIAASYRSGLRDCAIILPPEEGIYFRFPVRVDADIPSLIERFASYAIHARRGVDALLHHSRSRFSGAFPSSEETFNQTLSLPIYPALTEREMTYVITTARKVFGTYGRTN